MKNCSNPAFVTNHSAWVDRHQRESSCTQSERRNFRTDVRSAAKRVDDLVESGINPNEVVRMIGKEFPSMKIYQVPADRKALYAHEKSGPGRPLLYAKSAPQMAAFFGSRPLK